MAQVINTNVSALNAQRNLNKSQMAMQTNLQRLSSGLRINSAKDDAAGLAISDRFMAQINGLGQASRNANDGISLAQTAEGALDETTNALQRMRTLAVQAANDTNSESDRQAIQLEIEQLVDEINRIGNTTQFNGKNLLDGSVGDFNFQVGANAGQQLSVNIGDMRASALGQQPGAVQTIGHRVGLAGDAANAVGVAAFSSATTAAVDLLAGTASLAFDIQAGSQNVNITDDMYGGAIKQVADADLTDTESLNYGGGAAKDIAERINNIREMGTVDSSGNVVFEGVYATARTDLNVTEMMASSGGTSGEFTFSGGLTLEPGDQHIGEGNLQNGELKVNGVDIGPVTIQENDADGSLVNAINSKSDLTGVRASVNDQGQLELSAEDGRDIVLQVVDADGNGLGKAADIIFAGGGTEQEIGADVEIRVTGRVTISAGSTITVDSGLSTQAASGGFADSGTVAFGAQGSEMSENVQAVGTIQNADVTTINGANTLMKSVDSALKQVDSLRANLGAMQNRFEMTIRNLDNVSENLSAANSRIRDADFAAETTAMTRNQILQQAGISMLSQANAQSQNVMSLLR